MHFAYYPNRNISMNHIHILLSRMAYSIFPPCTYSWICDGIKRDLLSSSSTYVDSKNRVKGEKFQHNFLASLWVFHHFSCSQTNQTFPLRHKLLPMCHSSTSTASPMLSYLVCAMGHLHLNKLNEYYPSSRINHECDLLGNNIFCIKI